MAPRIFQFCFLGLPIGFLGAGFFNPDDGRYSDASPNAGSA
jgi:hypothetical protein